LSNNTIGRNYPVELLNVYFFNLEDQVYVFVMTQNPLHTSKKQRSILIECYHVNSLRRSVSLWSSSQSKR